MTEEFLHYIWKFKNFSFKDIKSTSGENIRILKSGEHNTNAGPDFLNAQVNIGKVRWAGSVEIHTKTSLWNNHGHDTDKAYDNVILHVVYEDDLNGESKIPVLELKGLISESTISGYDTLLKSRTYIHCEEQFEKADSLTISSWIERMTVERLESRLSAIEAKLKAGNNDWREVFYQYLGRNFGFKTNGSAFERLAETLPQKILAKHRNNLTQIEALLYGQAGFLENNFEEEYPRILKKEFSFLRKKYSLTPIEFTRWKFLRMRPDNFPTIRISQFARLAYDSENLFSKILELKKPRDISKLLEASASEYWNTHYTFDKISKTDNEKKLGKASIDNILINTVAPMMYAYGHLRGEQKFKDNALHLLELTKPERNAISNKLEGMGFDNKNAFDSQGLLQLKKEYCEQKRCLSCSIGVKILRANS